MSRSRRPFLSRLARARDGAIAVEFALIMPVMCFLYLGGVEASQAPLIGHHHAKVKADASGRVTPKFVAPNDYALPPNIVLQQRLLEEFVDVEIDADKVRSELKQLLESSEARDRQLEGFKEIDELLGPDDAISKSAELALTMLRKQ